MMLLDTQLFLPKGCDTVFFIVSEITERAQGAVLPFCEIGKAFRFQCVGCVQIGI